jgi:ferredoxin
MKIRLDDSACAGHALCNSVDPELFPLNDDGYSAVEPRAVPLDDERPTRDAVAICPERALILDEDG